MNMKIFICYSFDTQKLPEFINNSEVYVPIKCGNYDSIEIEQSDNAHDGISEYNKYINEMTMIHWIGKNQSMLENLSYIGIAHYRRYLSLDYSSVSKGNIYCVRQVSTFTNYQMYSIYHVKSDLDLFIKHICDAIPNIQSDLYEYFNSTATYTCNIFLMDKNLFTRYYSFIDKCIEICISTLFPILKDQLNQRDRYQMRALGFILERMTGFWIWQQSKYNTAKIVDTPLITKDIQSIYTR